MIWRTANDDSGQYVYAIALPSTGERRQALDSRAKVLLLHAAKVRLKTDSKLGVSATMMAIACMAQVPRALKIAPSPMPLREQQDPQRRSPTLLSKLHCLQRRQ